MRDINEPLRIAYAAALSQIANVPVFYQYLPSDRNENNYIVFRSINNNDTSTKSSFDTVTNITVEIHTKSNIGNRGLSADTIADYVLQLIYPSKQTNLSLNRGQMLSTEVSNDVTQDFTQRNQFGYISRFITFRHNIFVEGTSAGSGRTVLSPGAVFRKQLTVTAGQTVFTDGDLQNKNIIDVSVDGVSCTEIITSGVPQAKEALYDTVTGSITLAVPTEGNEKIFVLYQLN